MFFKEEDKDCFVRVAEDNNPLFSREVPMISIERANRLLKERGQLMYGRPEDNNRPYWSVQKKVCDTHRGRLVGLEPIKEEKVSVSTDQVKKALGNFVGADYVEAVLSRLGLESK